MSTLPATHKAVRLHILGEAASLTIAEEPLPVPAPGEVLVRVHAAAITRDELTWPEGQLPAIPAHEFSGEVVETGRPVYALVVDVGAAAEYIAVAKEVLADKPDNLSHLQAATVPLAALSAWQALFEHGALAEGQRVLIHGAAGAVGAYAVQLAHRAGAHVIAVTSTPTLAAVTALGADEVIDRTTTRFEDVAGLVDLVFDTVGGDLIDRSRAVLVAGGRLVTVAEPPADDWAGTSGASASYFIVVPRGDELAKLTELVEAGELLPPEVVKFPLDEAIAAFEESVDHANPGKVVFEVIAD